LKVGGVISSGEDAAEDFRMERFDTTVHDFWESGVLSDFHCVDSGIFQEFAGSTGTEDFYPASGEAFGKIK
jgi:hypothetical protein